MNLSELIAEKCGKPLEWAQDYVRFLQALDAHHEHLTYFCDNLRDAWAIAAVNVEVADSPRFAYLRGKSDFANDLPARFQQELRSLLSECNDQIEIEEE